MRFAFILSVSDASTWNRYLWAPLHSVNVHWGRWKIVIDLTQQEVGSFQLLFIETPPLSVFVFIKNESVLFITL